MKAPKDGWDADEREALESEELRHQLEAMRAAHTLGSADEARLLERVQRQARGPVIRRDWLLAAAVFLIAGTIWVVRYGFGGVPESDVPPAPSGATAAAPSPVWYLTLEKPAIKISPSSLAFRGPGGENPLLADLKPAFDAFRADDYAGADREFSAIASRYPASIEIALYQGVARLFLGHAEDAIASLTAAGKLADGSFTEDVAWYRAIADERAGDLAGARARLADLCAGSGSHAKIACEALTRLPGGKPPAP